MTPSDAALVDLAQRLTTVPGVVGVMLGGSRARGDHTAGSDVDLGLYYRPPMDVDALGALARTTAGPGAEVTEPGGWGPWVDGGGWLTIDGTAVDWIYRDVDRVQNAWACAQRGEIRWHQQTGHPLGVLDVSYAGEVALGVVLADPTGELTALRVATADYPEALADALVNGLWEAGFCVTIARKAVDRGDAAYVAGCLFRAVVLCAHALHGRAGRWLINEKGAVAAAGRLSVAPPRFAERATGLLGAVGTTRDELARTLDDADALVADTVTACRASLSS